MTRLEADGVLADSEFASAGRRVRLTDVVAVRMAVLRLQDEIDSSIKVAQCALNLALRLAPEALDLAQLVDRSASLPWLVLHSEAGHTAPCALPEVSPVM